MWGIDFIHNTASILMLAAAPLGPMKCAVPKGPQVVISPRTAEIAYDFSRSTAELSAMARKLGTTPTGAPQGRGQDSQTGGLRYDRPVIKSAVTWGYTQETMGDVPTRVCLWYSKITVDIEMKPVIYLAKERSAPGPCRDAILIHERRHVQVDREVMNRFAADVGRAIQRTVDETGAFGPFPAANREALGKELIGRIHKVLDMHEKAMSATMDARQMEVDSAAEYARISKICQTQDRQQRMDGAKRHWNERTR